MNETGTYQTTTYDRHARQKRRNAVLGAILAAVFAGCTPPPKTPPPKAAPPAPRVPTTPPKTAQAEKPKPKPETKKPTPPEKPKPKFYETGKSMLYGMKGGLLYGIDVTGYGGWHVEMWVIVQNEGNMPQVVTPYKLVIFDATGAIYMPESAQRYEGSTRLPCNRLIVNPHTSDMVLMTYVVAQGTQKYYFAIPGRDGDCFVIQRKDETK